MRDLRIEKLAINLLKHSINLQKGEKILIERMILMALVESRNIVENLAEIKTGITVHADDDFFYVSNHNSKESIDVPMIDFLSAFYKYRNEILYSLLEKIDGLDDKDNLYLDTSANKLIDHICESNRLIY